MEYRIEFFLHNYVQNISDSKNKSERYYYKCTQVFIQSTGYSCPLNKTYIFQTLINFLFNITSPQPLQMPVLHRFRSNASTFSFQYNSFPLGHRLAAYVFFLLFSLFLSLLLYFLQLRVLKDSSFARYDQSIYPSFYLLRRIFLFSFTLCNSSSFLTRPV